MIWKRIRTWLGPDADDHQKVDELDRLFVALGYPPEPIGSLDDHSRGLLMSDLPESVKLLASRGWLIRFDSARAFGHDGTHGKVISLMLKRGQIRPPSIKEHWYGGVLHGVVMRRSGQVSQVHYLQAPAPTEDIVADVDLISAVLRRQSTLVHSRFSYVRLPELANQAMLAILPRAAMRTVLERRLLPIVPDRIEGAPVFVSYSEDLLQASGLRVLFGALNTCSSPEEAQLLADVGCVIGELRVVGEAWKPDAGLDSLRNITSLGALTVADTQGLTTLDGLDHLSLLGGGLLAHNNRQLEAFDGLNNLRTVNGTLSLRNNPRLNGMRGLYNLTSVEGHVEIADHHSLKNLRGLDQLQTISGDLKITGNRKLNSLRELTNLTFIGGDLVIADNPQLTDQAIRQFCDRLRSMGFAGNLFAQNGGAET